jgi:hypothetical protein
MMAFVVSNRCFMDEAISFMVSRNGRLEILNRVILDLNGKRTAESSFRRLFEISGHRNQNYGISKEVK